MIIVSAISSFPRRRESSRSLLDSRLRGNDVYAVAEFMIKAGNYLPIVIPSEARNLKFGRRFKIYRRSVPRNDTFWVHGG